MSGGGREGAGEGAGAVHAVSLFTPEELDRLDRLRLRRRRAVRAGRRGEWRSRQLGLGGLFADHRAYVAGDDPRYVDWNVYGRLGDLVVKRFEEEQGADLLLLVDRSPSMAGAKAHMARRLAGALGHIALAHLDRVRLAFLPPREGRSVVAYRARARAAGLHEDLVAAPAAGRTDHVRDLGRVLGAVRRRGLAVVLSDFFDPAGAWRGLALLRSHGLEVGALHVVDPADADLPQGASVLAVDRESGETLRVEVTAELRARVHEAWRRRALGLERWCRGCEMPYLRVDAREPLWDVLRDLLAARVGVGA